MLSLKVVFCIDTAILSSCGHDEWMTRSYLVTLAPGVHIARHVTPTHARVYQVKL